MGLPSLRKAVLIFPKSVDKRVRTQGKKGKAAWSKLEEVLADRKLEKDLRELFDEE